MYKKKMLLLFSTNLIQLQDCVNNVDFFEKNRDNAKDM